MSTSHGMRTGIGPPAPDGSRAVGQLIRRHPLTAFLVWFFTVGQALAFTPVVAKSNGVHVNAQMFIVASTLVGLLLPAVVITRITDGPDAVRALARRSIAAWVSLRWYALALAAVPLTATALALLLVGMPTADMRVSSIVSALAFGLLIQTVIALIPNNWAEEVAWMGFFQSRVQNRTGSAMKAAVLTGPLFALQHVALVVGNPPIIAIAVMSAFVLVVIPFRAVIGWIYNRTGSLFLVGFVHAAANATATGSGFGDGFLRRLWPDDAFVGVMHSIAFVVIGIAVIVATRGHLGLATRNACRPTAAP